MLSVLGLLFSTGRRRTLTGRIYWPIRIYTALFTIWVLWAAVFSRTDTLSLTVVFLSLIFVPSFLIIGATDRADFHSPSFLDWFLSLNAAVCAIYFIKNIPETATRISLLFDLRTDQFYHS